MKGGKRMQHKKKTRFQKITMVAIWLMLIAMLGSLIFGAIASLGVM
jgi:cell division septal protein FtsQ